MIGVFDSGHGGLTVLKSLVQEMPDQSFVYLGDHGHAPYGVRSPSEIQALTQRSVELLFSSGCQLVVLACNTAAAVALRNLQQNWLQHTYSNHRILGVLVPMVEAITNVPWHVKSAQIENGSTRTVGVFATARTVESGAYPREILSRAPFIRVFQQPCPDLAGAIEAESSHNRIRDLVGNYVSGLLSQLDGCKLDDVVLGCTHYPLVKEYFADFLPVGVRILDQSSLSAISLRKYLQRRPEFGSRNGIRNVNFLTSGYPKDVSRMGSLFFGQPITFERVSFPDSFAKCA